ncbi:MAG: ferrous iron transport protein A [Myxococcales bacterium]|nr:ferrous iron transport protein A [Myxococcales bacterium]
MTTILNKRTFPSVTLDQVAVGTSAVVRRVAQTTGLTLRLMEMGLVTGASIAVRKKAPFGGPIELDVGGYRLSIRCRDARQFEVEAA